MAIRKRPLAKRHLLCAASPAALRGRRPTLVTYAWTCSGPSKCQCVPHRALPVKTGSTTIMTNFENWRDRCLTAAGARAHVPYSPNVSRSIRVPKINVIDLTRQRQLLALLVAQCWVITRRSMIR
eukprot:scaffold82163_cov66-Phaeocystis_antarctica.AAC.3